MKLNLLLISGSLRSRSYNTFLLNYVKRYLMNKKVYCKLLTLENIPYFNEDLENNLPSTINELIETVKNTDAFIVATPEYNNFIPGVLKNFFDWLSRDYLRSFIKNKPIAICGCTVGGFGTVRAQNELLLLLTILGFHAASDFRLPISNANNVFDTSNQEVKNEETSLRINEFVDKFVRYVKNYNMSILELNSSHSLSDIS